MSVIGQARELADDYPLSDVYEFRLAGVRIGSVTKKYRQWRVETYV
jgi:hypothetical protein